MFTALPPQATRAAVQEYRMTEGARSELFLLLADSSSSPRHSHSIVAGGLLLTS
jgi:hypothetical protein